MHEYACSHDALGPKVCRFLQSWSINSGSQCSHQSCPPPVGPNLLTFSWIAQMPSTPRLALAATWPRSGRLLRTQSLQPFMSSRSHISAQITWPSASAWLRCISRTARLSILPTMGVRNTHRPMPHLWAHLVSLAVR